MKDNRVAYALVKLCHKMEFEMAILYGEDFDWVEWFGDDAIERRAEQEKGVGR